MFQDEHIGACIHCLSRGLKNANNRTLTRMGAGVTGEQCRVLGYIKKCNEQGNDVFQRDLEHEFSVTRASIASILSRLEQQELIIRVGDDSDKRLKKVKLTAQGEELAQEMWNNLVYLEGELSRGMTEEERKEFLRLLKIAAENVSNLSRKEN